jgi:hypothetical protein
MKSALVTGLTLRANTCGFINQLFVEMHDMRKVSELMNLTSVWGLTGLVVLKSAIRLSLTATSTNSKRLEQGQPTNLLFIKHLFEHAYKRVWK